MKKIKQDWTTRRKKEYDGNVAPAGSTFLIMTVRKKFEIGIMIQLGKEKKYEDQMMSHLRGEIKKKYNI